VKVYGAVCIVRRYLMGDDGAKAATTTTIVRLRELLHRWALGAARDDVEDGEQEEAQAEAMAMAAGGGAAPPSIPPFVLQRLRRTLTVDSDDESCHSPEAAPDVPRGYCPVYVGLEQRRFVIPTSYLGHPVFRLLLEKAEEEFGFRQEGALAIPCETEAFKYILQCVERHDKGLAGDDADGTLIT
jgi:SAUR family protein